jgi:hypothetical protein
MTLKLNEADPTKTAVQTRDGRKVVILDVFEGRIFGRYLVSCDNRWRAASWSIDGKSDYCQPADLVNVPEKRLLDVWINVWSNTMFLHESKESAQSKRGGEQPIACLHITREYTVGEGLE